jgi:excisionase family DNA binding protein
VTSVQVVVATFVTKEKCGFFPAQRELGGCIRLTQPRKAITRPCLPYSNNFGFLGCLFAQVFGSRKVFIFNGMARYPASRIWGNSNISFVAINSYNRLEGAPMANAVLDPILIPNGQREQVRQLKALLQKDGKAYLVGKGGEPALELPDAVYSLLLRILQGLQDGKAISVVPITQDLTTQQAASFLGVSRPFFVKLLESGKLPYHMTGSHRRVYLRDLTTYKEQRDRERLGAIDRIAQFEEDAGIYDKVLLPED